MAGSAISRIRLPRAAAQPTPPLLENRERIRPRRERADTQAASSQLAVALGRRKWSILAFAVVGGVLAALVGLVRPVMFEATSQLIIDPPARSSLAPGGSSAQDLIDSSIDDHITMLSSQGHLRRVATALHKVEGSTPGQGASKTGISRPGPGPAPKSAFAAGILERLWPQSAQAAVDSDLKLLRNRTRIGQELRSRIISVAFADEDPVRAATVANTFAQVYVDELAKKRQAEDRLELDAVVANLPRVQTDLVAATDRLEKYRLSHGAVDQGSADSAARERADLSQQISMSKADLAAMESRLQHIQDLRKENAPVASLADALGTPELADLAARQASAPADKNLSTAIANEIEQGVARVEAEVNTYRAQVGALEDRKNVLDAVAADTATRLSGLRALEPQVSLLTQRYNELLSRQQDLMRRIGAPSAGVSILSPAWPPAKPQTLPPIFLVPPGMVAFAILGAVFVLVRNRFNRTLRGEVETEAALRIPCIGLIPDPGKMHMKQLRELVLGESRSAYSRAVTSLLVAAAPNQARMRSPHTIFVTSSLREDGANELAWSLALAATRLGGPVLLIDLERAHHQLTQEFLHQRSGPKALRSFGDFISNRCSLEDAVATMPEAGVDLMTVAPSEDLLRLLARADSLECRDELQAAYGLVIINGPPGLAGPEARFLTNWADAILFAIRWSRTPRNTARAVLELLQRDGAISVPTGSVLTGVNLKRHAKYQFGDSADLLFAKLP
ncbi:exopolysaccharide biosynthesis protein [Mesorhizobium sp. M3A.F.Ca.ET.174.01.1.1]|uniref:GumC family protein n=1 Tax=unclassified Mesorhizobium TaxID=325217 RepID=UPI0010934B76|nr:MULTISPECIES: exopolysaccharide transport family protein [unclassified Mesorhizobium]TGS62772.1 exopolysaccharide biosynthesis protein [Mesorhizobium sp. M3A.F.Ca.ET.201.01.1.1]TGS84658.1 exopolysaccharide biosynthesis protein [Mesorhizobium sp. M3A.F.Ca.ET.175.01.1.1]TGT22847.1 exopolysaccharide biosynthesis protein [Mesorhizobium sp. M3A.F.Ca.ET.174.01.1.1]